LGNVWCAAALWLASPRSISWGGERRAGGYISGRGDWVVVGRDGEGEAATSGLSAWRRSWSASTTGRGRWGWRRAAAARARGWLDGAAVVTVWRWTWLGHTAGALAAARRRTRPTKWLGSCLLGRSIHEDPFTFSSCLQLDEWVRRGHFGRDSPCFQLEFFRICRKNKAGSIYVRLRMQCPTGNPPFFFILLFPSSFLVKFVEGTPWEFWCVVELYQLLLWFIYVLPQIVIIL
jgi:hypothetical protein